MPALPLDEAGKYVAGAYVVFVALLLIYVAIMAARLARIDRELGELADCRGEATRGGATMAELLALGVSHKTAPLELRERMALTEGRAVGVLGELLERAEVLEAAAISTCNRTELYLFAADPVGAEAAALGLLAREAETQPTELVGHLYSLRAADRRRAPVAGDRGARLDDHRRGRDPGPGQARLRARPGRGRHRPDPQPALPRRARRRQAGALGDRDLGALDVGPLGRGRARPADARRARGPARRWSSAPARRRS